MSLLPMTRQCVHCRRTYRYNPSTGDLGLVCDSFNLSRASSLADDEVLGNASIDFCQVGDNNVLTFLFLYTFFNSLYELFNCVHLSFLSYLIYILYFSAKIHYYNGKST